MIFASPPPFWNKRGPQHLNKAPPVVNLLGYLKRVIAFSEPVASAVPWGRSNLTNPESSCSDMAQQIRLQRCVETQSNHWCWLDGHWFLRSYWNLEVGVVMTATWNDSRWIFPPYEWANKPHASHFPLSPAGGQLGSIYLHDFFYRCLIGFCLLFCSVLFLRQGLSTEPRLSWNSLGRPPGLAWNHRDSLASTSQELGLKVCTIIPGILLTTKKDKWSHYISLVLKAANIISRALSEEIKVCLSCTKDWKGSIKSYPTPESRVPWSSSEL